MDGREATDSAEQQVASEAAISALGNDSSLLDHLMTTLPDSIYVKDRASRFVRVNWALARRCGLSTPQEVVGKTDADLFGAEHAAQALADEQRIMTTGEPLVDVEEREDWRGGRVTWVSTTKAPLRDTAGRIVGLVGVSREITERKRLEERYRQAHKMEAIGRLAGGVAHDFNNILGVIIGNAEALEARLPAQDPLSEPAQQILKAASRGAALTRQLLTFSRLQVLQPRAVDLNSVVAETQAMLRRLIGEDIVLETVLARGLGAVLADPGQLGQMVMNLALNARDAMALGGRLRIETENAEFDAPWTACLATARPGRYVQLAVSDTGCGILPEVRAHLFEPFYTTKEPGKGTGLGLSTVYGIVSQSGGYICVDSDPSLGTTFRVYLPRTDAEPVAPSEAPQAVAAGAGETVLLVEDEESLRHVVRDLLVRHGYEVLVAPDGTTALNVAAAHSGPIDLLITDLVMPGMRGRELAQQIRRNRSQIRVLFMSGYTQDAATRGGESEPGTAFLAKPFPGAALLRRCRELLASTSSSLQLGLR